MPIDQILNKLVELKMKEMMLKQCEKIQKQINELEQSLLNETNEVEKLKKNLKLQLLYEIRKSICGE